MKIRLKKISTNLIGATILLTLPIVSMAIGECGDLVIDFAVLPNSPNCELDTVLINQGHVVQGKVPKVITQQTSRIILRQYIPAPIKPELITPNLKVKYKCGAITYTISSRQSASGAIGGPGKVRAEIQPAGIVKPKKSKGKCPFFSVGKAGHISWELLGKPEKK